jgi:hypothetical protein
LIGISLTPATYGEIRAKLVALAQNLRIENSDGLETINVNDILFTKEEGPDNINVYLAYNGKLIKEPKLAKQ